MPSCQWSGLPCRHIGPLLFRQIDVREHKSLRTLHDYRCWSIFFNPEGEPLFSFRLVKEDIHNIKFKYKQKSDDLHVHNSVISTDLKLSISSREGSS